MSRRSDLWYGLRPAWQIAVEAKARREHGASLRLHLQPDHIWYTVPIDVTGRRRPVAARIVFFQRPPYCCYGLTPEEYPRVDAAVGESSPHRMPTDNALCLYYPPSPTTERWRPEDGLLALIDLTRNHLFFEDCWRSTGGEHGGIWLGAEAPHGVEENPT